MNIDVNDEDRVGISIDPNESNKLIVPEIKSSELNDIHHCWICFATDEDDEEAEWVRPCQCHGTAKWVHQDCLQRWIDEKQKVNTSAKVICAQCKSEYIIVFPLMGRFTYAIEWCDRLLYAASPFAAATIVVGSLYWSAVSYGAITVLQVMGHEEGKTAMEQSDPLMLLVGLPSIPCMLILGKLIRWEDAILRLWRKYSKMPFFSYFIGSPSEKTREGMERVLVGRDTFSDPISATRMFCGALLLPTISYFTGRLLYGKISSNLQRILLGGLTFIVAKGFIKIYLRQQQYIRQSKRKVLNFNDEAALEKSEQSTQTTESSSNILNP